MQWYWCLTHGRAEAEDARDDVDNSLGPYPTEQDAENWRETVEARNEAWEAADKAWNDDEADDGADAGGNG